MYFKTRSSLLLFLLIVIFCDVSLAQKVRPRATPTPVAMTYPTPTPTPTNDQVLDAVEAQTKNYVETFKNLIAEETKTFELYGKNDEVKKRRVVTSSFIVFPLIKAEGQVVEFRNVTTVDGKKIGDSDKRAGELITKLASVETSEKEIAKLRDESSRHDLDIAISGMTLFQALAVDKDLRKFFEFQIETSMGSSGKSYSIRYKQIMDSPDITINASASRAVGRAGLNYDIDIDKEMPLSARLSGTIIVDLVSSRIVSEIRNVTIQSADLERPLKVVEDEFKYLDSAFGIYTPKIITHTQFLVKTKEMRAEKQMKITFEYGNFSRPDVEVKASEVKSKQDR